MNKYLLSVCIKNNNIFPPKVVPDLDIVIANGLAEEEEEEELPTPDVALLPHLKYGENFYLI